MFTTKLPKVSYSDPWIIPLFERIKTLAQGKLRIAYFYEEPNNSTFRYRAYNMVQALNDNDNDDVSASYFFLDDLERTDEIVEYADVLVICRSRYCSHINQLVKKFRVRGKRILFDVDDLVFDTKYVHLIMNSLNQDVTDLGLWDYWFAYISRMGETMRLCDGIITTNEFLAARISDYAQLPVEVVPNFINKEQLELSDEIFINKEISQFARDDKICLGYFSGSPSHNLDYAIITSALEEILINDSRIEIMIVGYIEAGPSLNRFGSRIKYQPFHDYVNLQRLISSVEFNLMPLQYNDFTNCKSELKYFEAAVVGTLSIASPSYTYSNAIRNGENGYISQAHQWVSVINQAVENIDTYRNKALLAREDARSKYAWFYQRETILKALGID